MDRDLTIAAVMHAVYWGHTSKEGTGAVDYRQYGPQGWVAVTERSSARSSPNNQASAPSLLVEAPYYQPGGGDPLALLTAPYERPDYVKVSMFVPSPLYADMYTAKVYIHSVEASQSLFSANPEWGVPERSGWRWGWSMFGALKFEDKDAKKFRSGACFILNALPDMGYTWDVGFTSSSDFNDWTPATVVQDREGGMVYVETDAGLALYDVVSGKAVYGPEPDLTATGRTDVLYVMNGIGRLVAFDHSLVGLFSLASGGSIMTAGSSGSAELVGACYTAWGGRFSRYQVEKTASHYGEPGTVGRGERMWAAYRLVRLASVFAKFVFTSRSTKMYVSRNSSVAGEILDGRVHYSDVGPPVTLSGLCQDRALRCLTADEDQLWGRLVAAIRVTDSTVILSACSAWCRSVLSRVGLTLDLTLGDVTPVCVLLGRASANDRNRDMATLRTASAAGGEILRLALEQESTLKFRNVGEEDKVVGGRHWPPPGSCSVLDLSISVGSFSTVDVATAFMGLLIACVGAIRYNTGSFHLLYALVVGNLLHEEIALTLAVAGLSAGLIGRFRIGNVKGLHSTYVAAIGSVEVWHELGIGGFETFVIVIGVVAALTLLSVKVGAARLTGLCEAAEAGRKDDVLLTLTGGAAGAPDWVTLPGTRCADVGGRALAPFSAGASDDPEPVIHHTVRSLPPFKLSDWVIHGCEAGAQTGMTTRGCSSSATIVRSFAHIRGDVHQTEVRDLPRDTGGASSSDVAGKGMRRIDDSNGGPSSGAT